MRIWYSKWSQTCTRKRNETKHARAKSILKIYIGRDFVRKFRYACPCRHESDFNDREYVYTGTFLSVSRGSRPANVDSDTEFEKRARIEPRDRRWRHSRIFQMYVISFWFSARLTFVQVIGHTVADQPGNGDRVTGTGSRDLAHRAVRPRFPRHRGRRSAVARVVVVTAVVVVRCGRSGGTRGVSGIRSLRAVALRVRSGVQRPWHVVHVVPVNGDQRHRAHVTVRHRGCLVPLRVQQIRLQLQVDGARGVRVRVIVQHHGCHLPAKWNAGRHNRASSGAPVVLLTRWTRCIRCIEPFSSTCATAKKNTPTVKTLRSRAILNGIFRYYFFGVMAYEHVIAICRQFERH